jgi:hypothetical protein
MINLALKNGLASLALVALLFPISSSALFDPNDEFYNRQDYLRQIGASRAWEVTIGTPDVVIAVIDTGVDVNHPELVRSVWRNADEIANDGIDNDKNGYIDDTVGWDFVAKNNDPRPIAVEPFSYTALNHGTVVSGIIAGQGNNFEGITGIAWGARIMPLRALDKDGIGSVENVVEAVNYAIDNGANIINLSFVGQGYNRSLYDVLRRAYDNDIVVVVASGNTGSNLNALPNYPICYDALDDDNWILGVTAVDSGDSHIKNASYGSDCVDVAAPGNNFFATQVVDVSKGLTETYGGLWSGTSLAAPVVSGVAALVKSAYPDFSAHQIIQLIMNSSTQIDQFNDSVSGQLGAGRVSASNAILKADIPAKHPPRVSTFIGARLVVATNETALRYGLVYGAEQGVAQQLWDIFDENFRAGGGIDVAENIFTPESDSESFGLNTVEATTIRRGRQSVVIGEGPGGEGKVRVYSTSGLLLNEWQAYAESFKGAINIAAADITGKGEQVILTAPKSNGGPHIRIFSRTGTYISDFFAYDKNLRGGWSLTASDLNGDGIDEIVVSSLDHNLPVRVFKSSGELLSEWNAYPLYKGGVNVAAGKLSEDTRGQVVVVPVAGGGPNLRIFDMYGNVLGQFFVLPENFRGGINVSVGDLNGDEIEDISVIPLSQGGPQVRFFTSRGELLNQFFVYPSETRYGVNLAIIR